MNTATQNIRRGRVVSVGDLKPDVPGSIPSRGTTVTVECPWATFSSLVLVSLPGDHE